MFTLNDKNSGYLPEVDRHDREAGRPARSIGAPANCRRPPALAEITPGSGQVSGRDWRACNLQAPPPEVDRDDGRGPIGSPSVNCRRPPGGRSRRPRTWGPVRCQSRARSRRLQFADGRDRGADRRPVCNLQACPLPSRRSARDGGFPGRDRGACNLQTGPIGGAPAICRRPLRRSIMMTAEGRSRARLQIAGALRRSSITTAPEGTEGPPPMRVRAALASRRDGVRLPAEIPGT